MNVVKVAFHLLLFIAMRQLQQMLTWLLCRQVERIILRSLLFHLYGIKAHKPVVTAWVSETLLCIEVI